VCIMMRVDRKEALAPVPREFCENGTKAFSINRLPTCFLSNVSTPRFHQHPRAIWLPCRRLSAGCRRSSHSPHLPLHFELSLAADGITLCVQDLIVRHC
jgi:hypothetical protein